METENPLKNLLPYKRYLKLLLKAALTGLALYLVFRKLNWQEVSHILQEARYPWLIPAFLLLLLSKVTSAFRMDVLLARIGLPLGKWYNTRLCFIGMYYNLFLPGGVGGDGYKVYMLKKIFAAPLKPLLAATLTDRLSGMIALIALIFIFISFSNIAFPDKYLPFISLGGLLVYPVYYLLLKVFFPVFLPVFLKINLYSLVVQGVQIVCVIAILLSLNVDAFFIDYAILFLISSIVAMLPITIGGAGMRETALLFLPGLLKMPVDTTQAVTMSLLFFLITVVSSLPGAFIRLQEKQAASLS